MLMCMESDVVGGCNVVATEHGRYSLVNCLFNSRKFVPCSLKIGDATSSKMCYAKSQTHTKLETMKEL